MRFAMSEFVNGVVKWFNPDKGYGFVICDGKDIFLHSKRLRESGFIVSKDAVTITLTPGDKLKFRVLKGPKGDYAVEISKA
jgi:CspA family cold shock protein